VIDRGWASKPPRCCQSRCWEVCIIPSIFNSFPYKRCSSLSSRRHPPVFLSLPKALGRKLLGEKGAWGLGLGAGAYSWVRRRPHESGTQTSGEMLFVFSPQIKERRPINDRSTYSFTQRELALGPAPKGPEPSNRIYFMNQTLPIRNHRDLLVASAWQFTNFRKVEHWSISVLEGLTLSLSLVFYAAPYILENRGSHHMCSLSVGLGTYKDLLLSLPVVVRLPWHSTQDSWWRLTAGSFPWQT
jgi:hypothetical protein